MNLEPVIQNEVSQKEKDEYRIPTHTYGIQKNGIEELIYRAGMETDIENRIMDMGEEKKVVGGMNGEINMKAYTPPCVKQITNGNLLYDSGNSNWGSR